MVRIALTEGLLFLAPFAAFALLLLLQRRRVLQLESWSASAVWLTGAGLLLVIGSLLLTALTADRPAAGFEPTHFENGRVVPGRFR